MMKATQLVFNTFGSPPTTEDITFPSLPFPPLDALSVIYDIKRQQRDV